jgi:ComF family protein
MKINFKKFLYDILYPKFCSGCQKEGLYLCKDCESLIEVSYFHKPLRTAYLNDLYFATEYKRLLIKKIIRRFKYEPLVRDLKKPLASLLINSFKLLDKTPGFYELPCSKGQGIPSKISSKFGRASSLAGLIPHPEEARYSRRQNKNSSNFVLIPIPLQKKRLRWRGFNQAEEIAKELSLSLKIPLINCVLLKIWHTLPQVKLSEDRRKKNIAGAFSLKNLNLIYGKSVLLVDDIYTTGSTMEEAAKTLKKSGVKKIIGLAIARSSPREDFY